MEGSDGSSVKTETAVPVPETPASPLKVPGSPAKLPTTENSSKTQSVKEDPAVEENFEMDSVATSAAAGQTLPGANMTFFVGLKAEMLPNNGDVWHPIKIIDMDVEEREVLCHHENSANGGDEWVCVDSCRIRPVQPAPLPASIDAKPEQEFQVNQKVMATWSGNRKFPAVIKAILADGSYEVLFMDGFRKVLKPNKLTKFTRKDQEQFQKNYPNPIPTLPPIVPPPSAFGSELLSKEERRKLKCKLNVKDLFADHRKKHKSEDTFGIKKIPNDDSRLKMVIKRKTSDEFTASYSGHQSPVTDGKRDANESFVARTSSNHDDGADGHKRKRFKNQKACYDYESPVVVSPHRKQLLHENPAAQIPLTLPVTIEGDPPPPGQSVEPHRRIPKLVFDEKLPAGWSKYCALKKCGTKFDVFIQSPEGRKCRSRCEIQQVYAEKGEEYPEERFNFIVRGGTQRRRKRKAFKEKNGMMRRTFQKGEHPLHKREHPLHKREHPLHKREHPLHKREKMPMHSLMGSPHLDPSRRIKTLLPKAKTSEAMPEPVLTPSSNTSTPLTSSGESGAAGLSASSALSNLSGLPGLSGISPATPSGPNSARVPCLLQTCDRIFRNENLLMMHMKHYHSEYTQILGSTPNVADLAYARTIGQSLEEVSPSAMFLDKINMLEKQKAAAVSKSPVSVSSPASPAPSPSRKRPENEVSEERIPFTEEKKVSTPVPRKIPEPCQLTKTPSIESPSSESKEIVNTSLEIPAPAPLEPELEKLNTTPSLPKKQSPITENVPKRRRFSKYGRNSLDADNMNSLSGKSGKKRTTSTSKSSTVSDYNESSLDASESGTESSGVIGPKLEQLKKEEVINCTCGYKEEDGLMIQCDLCLCWQHGMCNSIDTEEEVPEKYICYICLNPYRQRRSRQYTYNQDWLKEGTLPKFSFRSRTGPEVAHRESLLKRSHSVTATLVQLESVLHSLQAKINVAEKSDHPKLYLWSKPWNDDKGSQEDKIKLEIKEEFCSEINEGTPSVSGNIPGPEPEAAIDPLECRQRLLDHIDSYQNQIESRLTSLEAQIAALESQDPDLANDETPDFYPQTKQTIQMVMKDLQTVRRIATLS